MGITTGVGGTGWPHTWRNAGIGEEVWVSISTFGAPPQILLGEEIRGASRQALKGGFLHIDAQLNVFTAWSWRSWV